MKIVILDGHTTNRGDLSWEEFNKLGELTVYQNTDYADLEARAGDVEIVITNKTVFNKDNLAKLHRAKYIGLLSTGYNTIDLDTARERGIVVANIPAYSTDSVAQMIFAHILNITNRVDYYANENRNGRWIQSKDFCYWDFTMHELAEKKIGILGLGNTGMAVAKIANAFGMNVLALTSKTKESLPSFINKVTMDELLAESDIISLHYPLTDATRELINKETISKMKRGAILINTGRGPLINEQDVADALKSGQLSAFGADVMSQEAPKNGSPLFDLPNAFITPHIAWATIEARKRLIDVAYRNIEAFIAGNPQNVVNK